MRLIKIYQAMIGLLSLLFIPTGCEQEEILTLEDFPEIKGNEGNDPENEFIVEPDNGIDRVNSLTNAIKEHGDGTYILRRGGLYYFEGKNAIQNNVIIKSEEAEEGNLPQIQPIADANGAVGNNMINIEGNITLENVYINAIDAATGKVPDRVLVVDAPGLTLTLKNCFVDNCKQTLFRLNTANNKVLIDNSTIRNTANPTSPDNGRIVDTRGNNQESIIINNCYIYCQTDRIVRLADSGTAYCALTHNTFYNVGKHLELNYVIDLLIENNIFANYGWKLADSPGILWDIKFAKAENDPRVKDAKVTIRNNNFYFDSVLDDILKQFPSFKHRTELSDDAKKMKEEGRFIEENNFSEVLSFDYAPPLPTEYWKLFFEKGGLPSMGDATGLPFAVDEDGIEGIVFGETFTFNYPANTTSAIASTTGGPIGAQLSE